MPGWRSPDERRDPPLVGGIRVAVEEADGDRLVAPALQRAADAVDGGRLVEGGDHFAARSHAFRDLERVAARDHRFRLAVVDVVDGAPALALQGEDVAEPLGGEERDPGALALQHRVGRDGRAVHQIAGRVERETGLIERRDRAAVRRRRRARHLGDAHPTGLERDEVGERAADFDSHPGRAVHPRPPASVTTSAFTPRRGQAASALRVSPCQERTRIPSGS